MSTTFELSRARGKDFVLRIAYCVLRIACRPCLGGITRYPSSFTQYAIRNTQYAIRNTQGAAVGETPGEAAPGGWSVTGGPRGGVTSGGGSVGEVGGPGLPAL